MNKEFIPYKQALELKQLGFDEPCLAFYERNKELIIQECEVTDFCTSSLHCLAPTFSQAFRWFREKYGDLLRYDWGEVPHFLMIQIEMTKGKTYEEAELACLKKLIEIVKQPKKD